MNNHQQTILKTRSKSKKWSRIPTAKDLDLFNGLHCAKKYAHAVRTQWHCPSCRRTATELVRWSEIKGPSWRAKYADEFGMGFTVSLCAHHCHGQGRFEETTICGDCNSADGAAKRKLQLPSSWSFSPTEIGQFVKMSPHSGETIINYDLARTIFSKFNPPKTDVLPTTPKFGNF